MACKNLLQTDIVTCRAAIAARNANMTIECSNTLNYNSGHNNCTLTTAYRLIERQTEQQNIETYRATIAAKKSSKESVCQSRLYGNLR